MHKNSLVFLAPDVDRVDVLLNAVRQRMAWASILDNKDSLNLDMHNIKVAESRVAQSKQTVADAIREAYRWILVPTQEPGAAEVELEAILMNGDGTLAERVTKKADTGEFVVRTFSPSLLRMQINRLNLWKDKPYVALDALTGYFSQYVYMPKVTTPKVVIDCVWRLDELITIEYDGFAYADSFEGGRFIGLTTSRPAAVRQGGLLVDPAVATAQIEQDQAERDNDKLAGHDGNDPSPTGRDGNASTPAARGGGAQPGGEHGQPAAPPTPTRFHATKELTSDRVVRDVGQIYEEIIHHFVTNGVAVKVTLDVESQNLDMLTTDQRAAIRENLNTLGFTPDNWSMD